MVLTPDVTRKIGEACTKHRVEQLYVFGSALTAKFHPNSDADFLVRFQSIELETYFDNYLGLKEALSQITQRNVDLVEEQTLRNPVLKKSILDSRQLIYGRPR
ncbi:MAG: nucleotidyltransferase domain-containing protein [Cyclobacteriaceae bacterium]|jgi:hypothetical protein|nr:nucleotidyltransferase domain-containing protein [Cyclobacteriaceae bacterium]